MYIKIIKGDKIIGEVTKEELNILKNKTIDECLKELVSIGLFKGYKKEKKTYYVILNDDE